MADRRAAERAGRRAERLAEAMLRLKGYRIEARRYRCGQGEIDLVVRRGRTYAFVEVKARADAVLARTAVTPRNWQRIARAAEIYQAQVLGTLGADVRFDLVAVTGWRVRHHPDAWRPGG